MYWLHGLGGSPGSASAVVERFAGAMSQGQLPRFILVSCTDPTKRSMWTDYKDRLVPVETVIARELVVHVDEKYRTIPSREARAIEGFSMGGYGAAYLGFEIPTSLVPSRFYPELSTPPRA